jgi:hypothetical protein
LIETIEYQFRGMVLPERYDFNWSPVGIYVDVHTGQRIQIEISISHSRIAAIVRAPSTLDVPTIKNNVQTFVGRVVYVAGFLQDQGLDFHIESYSVGDDPTEHTLDFTGYVFLDRPEDPRFTFPQPGTHVALHPDTIFNTHFGRATHELRNSIRYPDHTAMHARAALEATRNAFPGSSENQQWAAMRVALAVSEATLRSFSEAATAQRHGRNIPQSWPQRQMAMQIAWEVVWRFAQYMQNGQVALSSPIL